MENRDLLCNFLNHLGYQFHIRLIPGIDADAFPDFGEGLIAPEFPDGGYGSLSR